MSDSHSQGLRPDLLERSLPPCRGHSFAVLDARKRDVRRKDHGCRDDGAGQAAAPGLIDAGDVLEPSVPQGIFKVKGRHGGTEAFVRVSAFEHPKPTPENQPLPIGYHVALRSFRTSGASYWGAVALSTLVLLLLSLAACAQPAEETPVKAATATSPYAFHRPDAALTLDAELDEISGLTVLADGYLAAVQDEDGTLYVIDPGTGRIEAEVDFGNDGDYEGIERVGNELWVLRSDGTLFEIENWQVDPDVEKHKTDLDDEHDTEGLAYDPVQHRLLIACKEYPGKGLKGQRAIYAFDVEREALEPAPVALIETQAVVQHLQDPRINRVVRRLLRPLTDASGFKPSALAQDPQTRDLYVLSSVQKVIAVLTPAGALRAVWPLPEEGLAQPEGLALTPDGDLFIASEGAGGDPMLLRFSRQEDS